MRSKRRVQNAVLSSAAILVVLAAILLAAAKFLGKAQDDGTKLLGYAGGGSYGYGLPPAYTRAPAGWRRVAVAPQVAAGESEIDEWQRVNSAQPVESADDEWQRVNGVALPVESAAGAQSAVREGVGAAAQLPSVLPTAFPSRALPQYASPMLGAYVIPSQPPLYSNYAQPPSYSAYAQYYPPGGVASSAPTFVAGASWRSSEPVQVSHSMDAPEDSNEADASSGESQEIGGEAAAADAGEGGDSPDTAEAEEAGAEMAPGAGSTLEEESDEVAADAAKKAALKEAVKVLSAHPHRLGIVLYPTRTQAAELSRRRRALSHFSYHDELATILSETVYCLNGFVESTLQQNRQVIVHYY
jgi:hypothetical protein